MRFSPLVKAGWADAVSVERVPVIAAGAEPVIFLAGRPAAKRAADAGVGRTTYHLLLVEFFIQNNGRLRNVTHET